jgi:DNA polymerase III subunit delta
MQRKGVLQWIKQYSEGNLLYIFWGDDEFSIEEALAEIKGKLGDTSLLSANLNLLDGARVTVNELKTIAEALPFLAPRRLIIIRGLLERFEPKDKSGRPRKSNGSGAKSDETRGLAECLTGLPESTIVVLTDTIEVRKFSLQNNALFKAISEKAMIKAFPRLKGPRLAQWVQARVDRQSSGISRQAADLLIQTIGDLHTMANEIDKLIAFTGGRLIEEKDVRLVVSASQEADVFAMIDAIMDRKAGVAEQILQKLLQNGVVPPQILTILARQVQVLVQIKEMKNQKKTAFEIQSKVGITSPYAWEKMSGRSARYTPERLKEIYQSLLKTDLSIKTGRLDGDLGLNILVADLCEKG